MPIADPTDPHEPTELVDAVAAVLQPLAHLCVQRGLPFSAAAEQLKAAFVVAAMGSEPEAARQVSRVSTATGISRREVTRLLGVAAGEPRSAPARAPGRSVVNEVFAHWTTARAYTDRRGAPKVLPRQGAETSFESLARSVTTDVHPRSILEQLVRLRLAMIDERRDTVSLVRDAFVPRGDALRMLGFLGANVGDHLAGAIDNVLDDGQRHFEQAVFADELSEASMQAVRALVSAQWKSLVQALVPALEQMIEDDRVEGREANRRLRIGLYTYQAALRADPAAVTEAPAPPPRSRKETKK